MKGRVLIHDPSGRAAPGTFLADDLATQALVRGGAITLPVYLSTTARVLQVGGYPFAINHWGEGCDFNANQGERGCPTLLYVPGPEITAVHWVASVERIPGEHLSGSVRLVTNPEQPGAMQGGLVAQNGSVPLVDKYASTSEGKRGEQSGTWTIGGHYFLKVQGAGYLGLCLYAVARGLRVRWTAASLA